MLLEVTSVFGDMKNAFIFGHKNVLNISRKSLFRVLQDMIK